MLDLGQFIAPVGENLTTDIWILGGPWVRIAVGTTSIQFLSRSSVLITCNDFAYTSHSGSLKAQITLDTEQTCTVSLSGIVDGNRVDQSTSGIPYSSDGQTLAINWSLYPLKIYLYHGEGSTEIDIGNIPVLNSVSFWIGRLGQSAPKAPRRTLVESV